MNMKYVNLLAGLCLLATGGFAQADEEVFRHKCRWAEGTKGVTEAYPSGCYPLGEPKEVLSNKERVELANPMRCPEDQTDEGKIFVGVEPTFFHGMVYEVVRFCRTTHG